MATSMWHPQEEGVKEICIILQEFRQPNVDHTRIWQQLQHASQNPDFNNYLAFILCRVKHAPLRFVREDEENMDKDLDKDQDVEDMGDIQTAAVTLLSLQETDVWKQACLKWENDEKAVQTAMIATEAAVASSSHYHNALYAIKVGENAVEKGRIAVKTMQEACTIVDADSDPDEEMKTMVHAAKVRAAVAYEKSQKSFIKSKLAARRHVSSRENKTLSAATSTAAATVAEAVAASNKAQGKINILS